MNNPYPRISYYLALSILVTFSAVASRMEAYDVPLSNQFVAMFGASVSTTVYVDTWTVINFNNLEADTAGAVTTGSAWSFKAPDTAYVQIQSCVQYGSVTPSAGGYDALAVFKNGTYIKTLAFDLEYAAFGYPTNQSVIGSTIIRCQKDDLIDVRLWHHGPSAATTSATYQECWITISRIR